VTTGLDQQSDPYFVGLFAGAIVHALRELEQREPSGARLILRQTLNEFLRSDIGKDPWLRRTLGLR
jgi:hypothetical protein